MDKYRKLGIEFLENNQACFLCGKRATQIHHTKGRIGANFLDTTTWAALCFECHYKLHNVKPELREKLKRIMEEK